MGFPNSIRIMAWNLAVILALFIASVAFFRGSVWVAPRVFPAVYLLAIADVVFSIVILGPCALFSRTRMFSAIGLQVSAFVLAAATWLFSFMVVYYWWHLIGLIAGLVMGVVGVVPLAMIAAGFEGLWKPEAVIVSGIILSALAYWISTLVASRLKDGFL
ncbi:MAG: hypothetical protein ACRED9_12140 [Caulobacteraceae bacterium]